MNPIYWIPRSALWIRKTVLLLRELRTHEQEILTVRDLIARELRVNERVLARYYGGLGIHGVMGHIQTSAWDQSAHKWSALRKRNGALWNEIADVYEELRATNSRGAPPPAQGRLDQLATRLEEAEI